MNRPDNNAMPQDQESNSFRTLRKQTVVRANNPETPNIPKKFASKDLPSTSTHGQEIIAMQTDPLPEEIRSRDIKSRPSMDIKSPRSGVKHCKDYDAYEVHELGFRSSTQRRIQPTKTTQDPQTLHQRRANLVGKKNSPRPRRSQSAKCRNTVTRTCGPINRSRSKSPIIKRSSRCRKYLTVPEPVTVNKRPKHRGLDSEDLNWTPVLANNQECKAQRLVEKNGCPDSDARADKSAANTSLKNLNHGPHTSHSQVHQEDECNENLSGDSADHADALQRLILETSYAGCSNVSPWGEIETPAVDPNSFTTGARHRQPKRRHGNSSSDDDLHAADNDYDAGDRSETDYTQAQSHRVDEGVMNISHLSIKETARGTFKRKMVVDDSQPPSQHGTVARKIKKVSFQPDIPHPFANKLIKCPMCKQCTLIYALEAHFRVVHQDTLHLRTSIGNTVPLRLQLNLLQYGENNCACLLLFQADENTPTNFNGYMAAIMVHRTSCTLQLSKYNTKNKDQYSVSKKEDEPPIEPGNSDIVVIWVCSNLPAGYRFLLMVENDTKTEGRMSYGQVHPIWENNDLPSVLSRGNLLMIHTSTLKKGQESQIGFEIQLKTLISKV